MSFTIKLLSNAVDYEKIIEYYNRNKKQEMRSLEQLDRVEGGFQIFKDITEKNNLNNGNKFPIVNIDINDQIHQFRWSKGCLCRYGSYSVFNETQLNLLYDSFINSVGKKMVEKLDGTMMISPTTHSVIFRPN
jgi:hypothetical protein